MKIIFLSKFRIFDLSTIVLMSALLSGCLSSQKADFPLNAASVTPVVNTETPFPTGMPSPDQTPSLTNTPVLPSGVDQSRCVVITQTPFEQLQGTLVLEQINNSHLRDILFLDLETQQEHFISRPGGNYYGGETVSPAGSYFSAETFTFSTEGNSQPGPIQVFDANGNLATSVELIPGFLGYKWLNEEQVLMKDATSNVLVSPFKRTQKKIQPLIKHIFYPSEYFLDWGFDGDHRNVYDPHMTRMLYPVEAENGPAVAVRDVEKGVDLASFSSSYGWGMWPTWSVDGEKFAMALNVAPFVSGGDVSYQYEIFVINRNGEKLFTTNLTSFAKTVYVSNLSWSPNGRYIAFWYTNDENQLYTSLQLAVLDTEKQTVTNYCISNADNPIRFSPIWAPSSDYLLIAYKMPGDKSSSSLLLNILDGKASNIKSKFEPLGWLR